MGQKKYKGLELDERTGGCAAIASRGKMIRLRAKVKGESSAREPPSGRNHFFRKTYVTARAVTYKAKAESKNAGKSACATEVRIAARGVSLRLC